MSLDSSIVSLEDLYEGEPIPVIVNNQFLNPSGNAPPWFEVHMSRDNIPSVRKTIYRNSKLFVSEFLPTISVSNVRSLIPKINNFKTDVLERGISISLVSEIWEAGGKKKFKREIERMKELDGLGYISTPRSNNKRGGGCAIIADIQKYSLEKISVHLPKSLEIVYGLLRPKCKSEGPQEIVAVAFYIPPKSKKANEVFENIVNNIQILLTRYPKAALYIGGDRNRFSISPLLAAIPKLRQIVTKTTCNGRILDVFFNKCC